MLTETDKQALQVIFVNCDLNELKAVRNDLGGMIDYKSQQNLRTFNIGDKIEWDSKKNIVMNGVITKINTKTVHCSTDKGPWRIHISLIRKIKDMVEVV
jgi:hypothetical protein